LFRQLLFEGLDAPLRHLGLITPVIPTPLSRTGLVGVVSAALFGFLALPFPVVSAFSEERHQFPTRTSIFLGLVLHHRCHTTLLLSAPTDRLQTKTNIGTKIPKSTNTKNSSKSITF
jgi:hypothetical protein